MKNTGCNDTPSTKGTTMQSLTMAMKISSENYPVALACLGAGFAAIPIDKVLGCYLVINEVDVLDTKLTNHSVTKRFALSNGWYGATEFWETYNANQDQVLTTPFHVRLR